MYFVCIASILVCILRICESIPTSNNDGFCPRQYSVFVCIGLHVYVFIRILHVLKLKYQKYTCKYVPFLIFTV